jgi:hypothetical protein
MLGAAGVTAIDTSFAAAGETVMVAVALMPLTVADTVVVPAATAVAKPVELMVATAVLLLAQVTVEVTSPVVPSLKVPVAVNCWVAPMASVAVAGVAATDVSVLGVVVDELPQPAIASARTIVTKAHDKRKWVLILESWPMGSPGESIQIGISGNGNEVRVRFPSS